MILLCLDIHAVTGSETAVLKNPIPSLKKGPPENPVATLGKRRFDSFTIALTRPQDRSSREKKSLNAAETQVPWRWRNTREIHGEIWPPVTTSHLLLPNEPRRAAFLLPFSRPNSDFLGGKYSEIAKKGGRGGSQAQVAERPVSICSHGNFVPSGAPPTGDMAFNQRARSGSIPGSKNQGHKEYRL